MNWELLLARSLEDYNIRELYLYQLPVLKTCNNWPAVKEIGRVIFEGKHSNYNGGIVKYAEKLYFVPAPRLKALAAYRKWNFKKMIKVVTEEDFAKKKNLSKIFEK